MDNRAKALLIVILLVVIYMGRARLFDIMVRSGGFIMRPVPDQVTELPGITVDKGPGFKKGPALWTQTTGLMCHCDSGPYQAPIVLREINMPQVPYPHFVYGG